jgi:hypothetical protein
MNWKHCILVVLLILNLTGAALATGEGDTCDLQLIEKLITLEDREAKLDYDGIYHLVKNQGKNVNCTFETQGQIFSPLLFAVSHMQVRLVKFLLEQGADANFIQPERNVTPLAAAAYKAERNNFESKIWKDYFEIANYLVYYGADYDYQFIMEIAGAGEDGSKKEILTSIRKMSPTLIKNVLKRQSYDLMGRTPKAKEAAQERAAKELRKAAHKRQQSAQKIIF